MALYLMGDVQGCDDALARLLDVIGFSPSRDRLWLLGDLVNRGPQSLAVLRRLVALGDAASCLLGNHDLHLLALASGTRRPHRSDTLAQVLDAPDRDGLLLWLRHCRMAAMDANVLMVHAGVLPTWTAARTLALAAEVEAVLRGPDWPDFMRVMYGNTPARWRDDLAGEDRLRLVVNALTRLRFVDGGGAMDFTVKDGADAAPPGLVPWFEVPGRQTAGVTVAFGHWSTLGLLPQDRYPNLISLDTGCVWGGCLSAMRVDGGRRDLMQMRCPQAQVPGSAG